MPDPSDPYDLAAAAGQRLVGRLGEPDVAVVLGSGWSAVADELGDVQAQLDVHELPGSGRPGVPGHRGTASSVLRGRQRVLVLAGRHHLYEGHDEATVVHLVRAAVLAGASTVVLTNAAGSLRADREVGSPVLISDHLNLTGRNPMCGAPPPPTLPSRFVDLTDLYSASLRSEVRRVRPDLPEGVYAGLLGASFETPAEIRMLERLGADLVGMSTVLEAIAARHLGAAVLGLSLVTNFAAGLQDSVDHLEVLEAGRSSTGRLAEVLVDVLDAIAE